MLNLRLTLLVPALTLTFANSAIADAGVSSSESIERLHSLRAEVQYHDELYFREAAPEISDAAYDRLKCELTALEQKFAPVGAVGEARASIGDDRSGSFATFPHRVPMLSLDKSYSETELRAFYARLVRLMGRDDVLCTVEPKFDGVAVSVTYEQGKLLRAVTRGNGAEGDDITANVLAIQSLPRVLRGTAADGSANPIPDFVELRGEIYLPLAEFARINEEREDAGDTPFAHPRNLAAGTMKHVDPALVAERGLAVVFYAWGGFEPAAAMPKSQQEFHRRVRDWGLPGVENFEVVRSADEMWSAVAAFERGRHQLAAPTDGLVVKLDSVAGQQAAGATSHAPRWAMAYKFAPDQVETRLTRITLQVGRSGVVTPVAELEPVRIGGSMVSRATLHSAGEIARRDFRVGDMIRLERTGEVIPTIAGVNPALRPPGSRPFEFPANCPSCGVRLTANEGSAVRRCSNASCPAQLERRLQHFASDSCMRISGLGPDTINALVERVGLNGIPDLYRLRREELAEKIPGFASEKAGERLIAAIERSRHAELWRVIYGLGIPHVGAVAAKALAEHFPSLDALLSLAREGAEFSAVGIAGLRPKAIESVVDYFSDPQNRGVVKDLIALGVPDATRDGMVSEVPAAASNAAKLPSGTPRKPPSVGMEEGAGTAIDRAAVSDSLPKYFW